MVDVYEIVPDDTANSFLEVLTNSDSTMYVDSNSASSECTISYVLLDENYDPIGDDTWITIDADNGHVSVDVN